MQIEISSSFLRCSDFVAWFFDHHFTNSSILLRTGAQTNPGAKEWGKEGHLDEGVGEGLTTATPFPHDNCFFLQKIPLF